MTLNDRLEARNPLLMEGALGERLKREFGLDISGCVGMASLVYNAEGRNALRSLWLQYLSIANEYGLPFSQPPLHEERIMKGFFIADTP